MPSYCISILCRGLFVSLGGWGEEKKRVFLSSHGPPRTYIIAIFIAIPSRSLYGDERILEVNCDLPVNGKAKTL